MSQYQVRWESSAQKQMRQLDPPIRRRVVTAIARLADDPRPAGCNALQGRPGYRIRVGEWRVIYEIDDHVLIVMVIRVGCRGGIYS